MKKKKIILGLLIVLLASFSFISEGFVKFILSGQSGSYNVILARHSFLIVIGIAMIAMLFNLILERRKIYKYLLGVSIVLLVISLKTFAIVKNSNHTILVSGFSFFPIYKCEMIKTGDSEVVFCFFLKDEVEKAFEKE